MKPRKIIHIDMDAFYASVEQRDNPELRGKPLAVGSSSERGVVVAASYEARKYGVRSAMPSRVAVRRCPHLIFTPPRREVYNEVSRQIREIMFEYTDLVEPLSLDEAYLDVTVNHINMPSATIIARQLKERIFKETGLTASAGVSINKLLAKIASDIDKPDGLTVITQDEAEEFVEGLKIERFWGVGPVTANKMHSLGIHTGADLKQLSEDYLIQQFGKAGRSFYLNARAIDNRVVEPDRTRKSVGAENTYHEDIGDRESLREKMSDIAEKVWERASRRNFYGRTVTLKIKYNDFDQITRSKTLDDFVNEYSLFWEISEELLALIDLTQKPVRLLGLTLSNIYEVEQEPVIQLEFDFDYTLSTINTPQAVKTDNYEE